VTGGADDGLEEAVGAILARADVEACIQCGRCTASCPAALPSSLRARNVIRAVQDGDVTPVIDRDDIWHCTTCFSCQERCPKGVLITQAILWLRAEAARRGRYPAAHPTAMAELARSGNVFPLEPEVRTVRGQLSLPREPADTNHAPDELAAFHRLLENIGFESLVPPRRPYDGEDDGGDPE
jgi:heterodisulfide reductase subunit C